MPDSPRIKQVVMDPNCLLQWPTHINDTTWPILSACKSPAPYFSPTIFHSVLWSTFIFLSIWTYFTWHFSRNNTLRTLHRLPSYELHETVEALYEKTLYLTATKETYKAMWRGRYRRVEYEESILGTKRTVTVVENSDKVPPTTSLGLAKKAGQVSNSRRPREGIRDTNIAASAPTRPAAVASRGEGAQRGQPENQHPLPPPYAR